MKTNRVSITFISFKEIKATHLGTNVNTATLPVGLSGELSAEFGIFIEGDVLNNESVFLAEEVDIDATRGTGL